MALIPFAVLWLAYQVGWYGFTTIAPYCGVGFADLMLPGKMAVVDNAMNAGKGNNCGDQNASGGSGSSGSAQPGTGPSGGAIIPGQQNNPVIPPGIGTVPHIA